MGRSFADRAFPEEDNRVGDVSERESDTANKVGSLPNRALAMAKAGMGAAVKEAIGDRPLKHFGDKGVVANVISGERVPDYLARIYEDREARRRLALALLKGTGVRARMVLDWDEEIA